MKQLWFLGLLTLLILTGCTGTQTVRAPTLLIVGFGEAGSGAVALVQDTYLTDQATSTSRFLFVPGSQRPLPQGSAPVAYDIAGRLGSRDTLAVLSRTQTNDASGANAFISLYDVSAIDPSQVAETFTLISSFDLSTTDPDNLYSFCPTNIQIDDSARYVAILNDQSVCNRSAQDSLMIIDLEAAGGPRIVQVREASVIGTAFYLYQTSADNDRLFYFTNEAAGPELRAFTLAPGNISASDPGVVLRNFAAQAPIDLTRVGSRLIALFASQFVPIANAFSGETTVETAVSTTSNSRRLIPLNSPDAQAVMILSPTQFTIHTLTQNTFSAAASASISAVDGSLEPLDGFVYLTTTGINNFALFDFREYDPATDTVAGNLSQSSLLAVPEISNPVFVSWVRSVLSD
jgi:hypothetical protein